MPVDKAELAKDLAENPEYQTLAVAELTKKEFVVRDKATDTTFLENYKKDVIEKEIPGKIKEVHDRYDKDVEETFGVKRNQDEKSYDYLKRAGKLKLAEIADLNEKIKKGDSSGVLTKKLADAEEQYKNQLAAKDTEISEIKTKFGQTEKSAAMDRAYAGVRSLFKKDLPPLFSRTERAVLDDILKTAVMKDGVIYAGNADGSIKKTPAFVEIKMEDYLKEEFKEVIETKKITGGGGSGGEGKGKEIDPSTITLETFVAPETVKSQDDLMTYMMEIGLQRGSKVFNDIFKKHGIEKKLPLTSKR